MIKKETSAVWPVEPVEELLTLAYGYIIPEYLKGIRSRLLIALTSLISSFHPAFRRFHAPLDDSPQM
jgi:hypothetical protein